MDRQYGMPQRDMGPGDRPRRRRDGPPRVPGGNIRPALEEHYGEAGPDALGGEQPLTPEQREHVDRMYDLYDEYEGIVQADH